MKQQQVDNQLSEAKQKADLQSQKLQIQKEHNDDWSKIQDKLADVQAQKVAAAKNGKSYEFEQLQNDWTAAWTKANQTDDPDELKIIRLRIKQDEDRMQKLSKFAAEIPTTKTTKTTVSDDEKSKVSTMTTGPIGAADVSGIGTNSFKVGGFTITPK